MLSPGDFDALTAHKAIEGLGTDDSALIELLCSRTQEQINALKTAYQERALFFERVEAGINSLFL